MGTIVDGIYNEVELLTKQRVTLHIAIRKYYEAVHKRQPNYYEEKILRYIIHHENDVHKVLIEKLNTKTNEA